MFLFKLLIGLWRWFIDGFGRVGLDAPYLCPLLGKGVGVSPFWCRIHHSSTELRWGRIASVRKKVLSTSTVKLTLRSRGLLRSSGFLSPFSFWLLLLIVVRPLFSSWAGGEMMRKWMSFLQTNDSGGKLRKELDLEHDILWLLCMKWNSPKDIHVHLLGCNP